MKNFFNFYLTGKKLFPVWLVFMIIFIVPYVAMVINIKNLQPADSPSFLFFLFMMLLIIIAYAVMFFIAKLTIDNVSYKGNQLTFKGTFGKFLGKFILGLFLSIITLGIYIAWFVKDIHSFFINNSVYNSQAFYFRGKGGKLFVILLLTIILPLFVMIVAMTIYVIKFPDGMPKIIIIQQIVMVIIMIPYMYFVYKWLVNVNYKNFNIRWNTNFWNSCGKIAIELILTVITIGIYFPLAILRLYKYFADRTTAVSVDREMKFGFEIDPVKDFLFIWGQTLLTIITLGIYYPWAYCEIGKRILSKTYIE